MRIGEFDLHTRIGQGGMGQVWRGKHRSAGVDVAVKVMLPEVMSDPEFRKSFETEVQSIAALDHPNIVTLLDFGVVSEEEAAGSNDIVADSPFIVMEYARGGAVSDYFTKILWPDLRELLLVVLDALAHAHAREVIHRDLKPENILVGCGEGWDVKLTDFGLAHGADKFADSGKVETAWGTPQYMAPEQLRGLWREYGPWTDLYGLGCMAYELICGKWPFDGETAFDIGQAHIQDPIPRLEPRFQVPEGVEDWIRTLLAKRRRNRFNHAADAAYALAQLPALENVQRFGVLFDPPGSYSSNALTQPVEEEGVSTQIVPEFSRGAHTAESPVLPTMEQLRAASRAQPTFTDGLRPNLAPPIPLDWRRKNEGTISNELMGISLGLFGLRATPLVDREEERETLWKLLLEVTRENEARQLLVQGAAGTGKSEIVRWMCQRAREVGGARVLSAFHSPILGPADGLVPMMERFLKCARLAPSKRENHLGKLLIDEGLADSFDLRALLALFDVESGDGIKSGRVQQLSREERFAIIYRYLSLLSQERPVIVWLDDVQWGLDAVGFADYVQRRQATQPAQILVIMTLRTEALADRPAVEQALLELMKAPEARRCVVAPLKPQDTEHLVRQLLRLDDELSGHILARSQGVPLFAVQLVEDWVARGKLVMGPEGFQLKAGADIAIPDGLHELWDSRIQGFIAKKAPETLFYLELGAAFGQEVDTREWLHAQRLAGLPEIGGLVERLAEENLARLRRGSWQFSHGMMQESLERGARESKRWMKWNDCCARALQALYKGDELDVPERLAWHLIEAGRAKDALLPLGVAVDQCIERSDYTHALELIDWREALIGAEPSRWKLKNGVDRARVSARRGEYLRCVEVGEAVAKEAETQGFIDLTAQACVWAGKGRRALGHLDRAETLLKAAHRHFTGQEWAQWQARCALELGRVEEQRGDFETALNYFEAARELFAGVSDDFGEAQSVNAIGDVTRVSGDFAAAQRASLKALDLYKKLGNVSGIADCLNDLSELSRLQGQLKEARAFADESLQLYSSVGSGDEYFVQLNLAMVLLEQGEFETATARFAGLCEIFEQAGQIGLLAQAKAGRLAADAGLWRWSGWGERIAEIHRLFESTGVRAPLATRALSIAARLAERGGETGLAIQARHIAREQTESIRHTRPVTGTSEE